MVNSIATLELSVFGHVNVVITNLHQVTTLPNISTDDFLVHIFSTLKTYFVKPTRIAIGQTLSQT